MVKKRHTGDAGGESARKAGKSASGAAELAPFVLTLRDVEVPGPPADSVKAVDSGLVMSDRELHPEPYLGDPDADRAEQRQARRAQVRRERQRDTAADEPGAPEILVLGADDATCKELCSLLQGFGFAVQVMAQVPALPAPWPFVAVFVTTTASNPDGGDTIDLCNQVRESSRLPGERKPVLVLAAQQLTSTDRVRAGLAGCHEVLLGPATRGAVAQLLDARGIALPSDARRG
jgi:hypothetical protein